MIKDELNKIKDLEVNENVNLIRYTTYNLSTIARFMVFPKNIDALVNTLKYLKSNNIKFKILGFGSNVIFINDIYDGVIIKLDYMNNLEIDGTTVKVDAGCNLIKLSLKCAKNGLSGLEFASGIPGSVGGAIYMNAGAYKSDMGYIVKDVTVLTGDYEVKTFTNREMDFHYRHSMLHDHKDYIVLNTTIVLHKGTVEAILEVIRDRKLRRIESQPLEYPSAGSVFRNPDGDYAGRLVEAIGYKGKSIGDAQVSTKHANFIINKGKAKGSDIVKLINEIKTKVKKEYKIDLKCEQEFVD